MSTDIGSKINHFLRSQSYERYSLASWTVNSGDSHDRKQLLFINKCGITIPKKLEHMKKV